MDEANAAAASAGKSATATVEESTARAPTSEKGAWSRPSRRKTRKRRPSSKSSSSRRSTSRRATGRTTPESRELDKGKSGSRRSKSPGRSHETKERAKADTFSGRVLHSAADIRKVSPSHGLHSPSAQRSAEDATKTDIRAAAPNAAVIAPLGAGYGSDFVANLIVYAGATGRVVDAREMLVYELRRTQFVPTAYLAPDFYYANATEPSVNYGTLGAFVAKMLFNRSIPEHRLPGHTICFARYARQHFNLAVPERHEYVDRLLRTGWAMAVARAASRGENAALADSKPLAQLFYLRFAENLLRRDGEV